MTRINTTIGAIIACILWSTAFVGIKTGLQYTTPLRFAGIRFFLAGLMILPFSGTIKVYFNSVKTNFKKIMLVSVLQTSLMYALFYLGVDRVPANIAAMIIGGGPIFTALMAHFLMHDDKLNLRTLTAILLGIFGVVLITIGRATISDQKQTELTGILFLIMANILGSLASIVVAKDGKKIPPLIFNSAQIGIGGVVLFILSLFVEPGNFEIKPTSYYLVLIYLSFLSAGAFSIWFILLKRPGVKVSELNTWKFIIPVLGAMLSWIILPEEKPQITSIVGMIIITSGLIILSIRKRGHQK